MQNLARWSRCVCSHHEALYRSRPGDQVYKHLQSSAHTWQHHRSFALYDGGSGEHRPRRDKDPTLGDIGGEIMTKVKQLPGAIYQGIANLANKLIPGRQQPPPDSSQRQQRSKPRSMTSGLFGGGLMGTMMEHTLGKAMENLAKGAAEQMQAAQQRAEELHQAATQAIQANNQLRQYLGGDVQVAQPISESSSLQMVNGRQTQMFKMVLPVVGSNGHIAHAHVQASEPDQLDIQVQLPNGRVITVEPNEVEYVGQDDDEYGPKGRVVDAEWREVR